ncbi:DUF5337 family protein [Thalassorhabdomicrobium marinisediminis]|uniref:Uncharacterized protein n=1 Tax=Thalassorhabdomicrobium marinisediminis TaxID=2170577 RepID=A0A2T7G0K2_9RHOB|nr:DUF5337 family protein [Thalassorhabdomicrobium marinisediminis]PVA07964.1 hypothetical protein DC363_00220 [Thalassorhabdomicrobium marinisediminis]
MSTPDDQKAAAQGRQIAIVIALAGLLAIFAPAITRLIGASPRVEMLFYLISLAAFIWSLVVTWNLWQKTKDK